MTALIQLISGNFKDGAFVVLHLEKDYILAIL